MENKIIISRSCNVTGNQILVDGKLIYKGQDDDDFQDFSKSVYQHFNWEYPKFFKMDPLSKLGFITSEILVENTNLLENHSPFQTGVVIANASSSLDTDIRYNATISNEEDYFPSPALFVYTLPNIMIGEICIRNGLKGENAFFVMEKFDVEFIHLYISDLFSSSTITSCICGWVDIIKEDYKSFLIFVERKNLKDISENQNLFIPLHIDRIFTKIHEGIN